MASPNEPPRRMSMSYILGFSNKPFKDPKPPPRPRPRPSTGLTEVLSTPFGVVEWVASDGRKLKLSGQGQCRTIAEKSNKASSDKTEDPLKSCKNNEEKNNNVKVNDKVPAEDNNPHGFTKEEDEKMLKWKLENKTKPWSIFADEVGRSVPQCKERYKQIKPTDDIQTTGNEKSKGRGGTSQQPAQPQVTKKEKKALAKEMKDAAQTQKNNQKGQHVTANPANAWDTLATSGNNDTGGNNDTPWGGMGDIFGDNSAGNALDKKSKKSNSSNKGENDGAAPAWDTAGGWSFGADAPVGGNVNSWDNTMNPVGDKKNETSTLGDAGKKTKDTWAISNGNSGDNPWEAVGGNSDGNKKGGGTLGEKAWAGVGETSTDWVIEDNSGGGGLNANTTWDTNAGGATGHSKNDWRAVSPKAAAANADLWTTGINGANDTTGGGSGASHDQTKPNNKSGTHHPTRDKAGAPASKPASKAPSQNSTHSRSRSTAPLEIELKPDSTFSADDLRLVARILHQDYKMVWDRLSWRFRDKTGRTVAPEVFEKKIMGHGDGEKKRVKK